MSNYSLTSNKMNLKLFILPTILIAGCTTTKLNTPSQNDVDLVKGKFPEYKQEQLIKGKQLYENHCGDCHELESPSSRTEEEWTSIVPEMTKLINKKTIKLNDTDQQEILKYVIAISSSSNNK